MADHSPLGHPRALHTLLGRSALSTDAASLLRTAAEPRHKLSVTLLSAWQAAGTELDAVQRAELAAHRRRIDQYHRVWPVINAAAPTAFAVKGPSIAAAYPAGLVRAAGDLDVICPADELWAAAVALVEQGWQVGALTVLPGQSKRPELLVELGRESDEAGIDEPYSIELRTVEVATTVRLAAQRPAGQRPPAAANVFAILAERWERPFRSRDVYDLAVLAGQLDPAALASLRAGLTEFRLWPEMRELARRLRRSGLGPVLALPGARVAAGRDRAVRLARGVVRWSHPARVLGFLSMSTVERYQGRLLDRLAGWVHDHIGPRRLLALGLPVFGVPLPAPSTLDAERGLRLVPRGRHLVAVTPVGEFLMVTGSCPQRWLDEATTATEPAHV